MYEIKHFALFTLAGVDPFDLIHRIVMAPNTGKGKADLIISRRVFIPSPDLPLRFLRGAPLKPPGPGDVLRYNRFGVNRLSFPGQ